jgi:DNA-binding NtrC family response regulator
MEEPKVLLIDDEVEFASALAERLNLRGIPTSCSSNGEDALKMMEVDRPAVVVLDVMMPGLSGMEILARIRSVYPRIGVILLTGHSSPEMSGSLLGLGPCEFLMKPVNIDELIGKIRATAGSGKTRDGKNTS